jgi:hypothetical protein
LIIQQIARARSPAHRLLIEALAIVNQVRLVRLVGAATLFICTFCRPCWRSEDVAAAAGRDDYATATWLLRPRSEHGNPVAQFDLGFLYDTACGLPLYQGVMGDAWLPN